MATEVIIFSHSTIPLATEVIIFSHSTIPFTILGFFLFLYAIFSLSRSLRNKTTPRIKPPPEAGAAWPVIGHLHLLGGQEPPHIALAKMADKYGPIFSLRLGVHPTLIVSRWEISKECFTANDLAFAGRPKILASEIMGYNSGMFGTYSYGPHYCHMRKIVTQEVLSNQRLEMLKHLRESEVKSALEDTNKRWEELNNNDGQNSESVPLLLEMKKWFGDISFSVVLRIIVGKRFDGSEENSTAMKALRYSLKQTGEFVISDALPYLRWLDLGAKEKAMKEIAKELDQFLQFWVDEHRRNRDVGSEQAKTQHSDFMDVLLSMADEADMIDGHDADTIIKSTCLVRLYASIL